MQDNAFQRTDASDDPAVVASRAFEEFSAVVDALRSHGVTVHVFDDTSSTTPDSVFPNNWFSTHAGGHIALYPMYAPNRRSERRADIIEFLKEHYRVQVVLDYSGMELDGIFLEGTGAMVLDNVMRVVYVARSHRADPVLLERFCTNFGYEPIAFDAVDPDGKPIYHTNVMMTIAESFAMVGLSLVVDPTRRAEIRDRLVDSGREVIELSAEQIAAFAGNAFELRTPPASGGPGRILALSGTAYRSLTPEQIGVIERYDTLVPIEIPTIELAGGSVRCMLAGIHLERR